MFKKTLLAIIALIFVLCSNLIGNDNGMYADAPRTYRSMNVQDYTIRGNGEECLIFYDLDESKIAQSSCSFLTNSKGINIICTAKKKMCKTEEEFYDFVNKNVTMKNGVNHSSIQISKNKVIGLPFTGERWFNFYGGMGTGMSITIKSNGDTLIEIHGKFSSSIVYKGKFKNPMYDAEGYAYSIKGNKIYLLKNGKVANDCPKAEGTTLCIDELLKL